MDENLRKENKMGTMPPMRLLLSMSLPLMISMFIQALYNIVDSVYVSQYSQSGLTALSLAFPVQMLMTAVAVGTSVGIYSLISRRLGARDPEGAQRAAGNGITLAVISSLVFVLLGAFFTEFYFNLVSDNPVTIELGIEYLRTVLLLCPGVFLAITSEKLMQSTGKTLLSMAIQIVGAVTNIILDPILIFGRYGFPELGIKGAAIATVVGQILSAVVGLVMAKFFNPELPLRLRELLLKAKTVGLIYAVGVPSIIMQSIGSLMTFLLNLILRGFSEDAVTVLGVYFKLNSFVFMPVFGLNSGQVPIIGYNYGARRKKRIMDTLKSAMIVGISVMVIGTALFELIPDVMFNMFNTTPEVTDIGVHAFRVIGLCFVPAAISIVLSGVFQGIGVGVYSMINSIARQIALLLPVAYLLANVFGLDYVWYAFVIAEIASLALMIGMFAHVKKKYIDPLPN